MTLDDIRRDRGWTWDELAELMGVPKTTAHNWHRVGVPTSWVALARLAEAAPDEVAALLRELGEAG